VYTEGEDERRENRPEVDSGASSGRSGEADSSTPASGADDSRRPRERSAQQVSTLDPRLYTLADEPLDQSRIVDYRYLYDLVLDRFSREEDRGRHLDGKLGALLAGVVASIGFSFRTNTTVAAAVAALLYLIPLWLIFTGYTTKIEKFAPTADSLDESFPYYPVSTLVEAIKAMRQANEVNFKTHDRKADQVDRAVISTLIVTFVVLVTQFFVAVGGSTHAANSAAPAASRQHDPRSAQGRSK
jgi:hypothetical protein